MALFSDVGTNCTYERCKERDFLPFQCEFCRSSYCLSHRTPDSHECTAWKEKATTTICPNCMKVLRIPDRSTSDSILASHLRRECGKEESATRCPNLGCRKKVHETNSVVCQKCHQRVCLSHRYEDMHPCEARRQSIQTRGTWTCRRCLITNNSYNKECVRCGQTPTTTSHHHSTSACVVM